MIWFLYNGLFLVGFTLLLPHFLWRMVRRGGYRRGFAQRLGWYDPVTRRALAQPGRIWIHAVSVGELFVAFQFMRALRAADPGARFVVTTTTSTGHAIAARELAADDVLLYFPVDVPPVMRRVLDTIRPRLLLLVECELWPNLIRACHARGIPVGLLNGRLSDRSFRGYRRLRGFTRRLLPWIDVACMQTEEDRARLIALGARPEGVVVTGSAKYDLNGRDPAGEQRAAGVLRAAGVGEDALVWLGGSTWPGEEAVLLDRFRALRPAFPALVLVLVPRHAERAAGIVEEIRARGLPFLRRSEQDRWPAPEGPPAVLLVDSTGELKSFYAHADLIFVGKSLTQHGGQNIIEPACLAKPIVVGPHMENFAGIVQTFLAHRAVCQVQTAGELGTAVERLLGAPGERAELGARAGEVVRREAGAIQRSLAHLQPWLAKSG